MKTSIQILKDAASLKAADIPDKELFFDFVKKNGADMEDALLRNLKTFELAFGCKHTLGLALFMAPFSVAIRQVSNVDRILETRPELKEAKARANAMALKGNMLFQAAFFICESAGTNLTASDKRILKSLLQDAIAKCES